MKKKIVGIFVCLMLVLTSVSMTVNSEKNIIDDEILIETNSEDDCGCRLTNQNRIMFMNIRPIIIGLDELSSKPTVIQTPEYFNWMDFKEQDWTSPAKDQLDCGSCWLFAAIGALESIINIREDRANLDMDLSEQYVLSCLPRAGNCIGGESYSAFYYIMCNKSSGNNCNGIIPEFCFPYRAIDVNGCDSNGCNHEPVLCDEKCEDWQDYLIPISDCGIWYPDGSPEDRDIIKSQIMQNGPVATAFMATWYIHDKDNFVDWGFRENDPDSYITSSLQFNMTNHCVVIVGWKDDSSIENGGYWICKNSWGAIHGFNGFFNIEYGRLRIDSSQIVWVDYNPNIVINWAPVVDTGGIYYGDVGDNILFDANDSFDHEGEITSFQWDFGDGSYESGITVTHSYEFQGVYPITLTVLDSDGNEVNDTTWAFIGRSNVPPNSPTIVGPTEGKKGIEYNYNFSTTDPDGDDIYYYIHWGDLTVESWIGPYSSGENVTLNHTWNDKATFAISIKAKDKYDFITDWTTFKITMSKNKQFDFKNKIINRLFERFPNAFPILKTLLKMTYEVNYGKLFLEED